MAQPVPQEMQAALEEQLQLSAASRPKVKSTKKKSNRNSDGKSEKKSRAEKKPRKQREPIAPSEPLPARERRPSRIALERIADSESLTTGSAGNRRVSDHKPVAMELDA